MKKTPLLTRLSVRLDTSKRAWVLVCMYVRTCVGVAADLCVRLIYIWWFRQTGLDFKGTALPVLTHPSFQPVIHINPT